MHKVHSARAVLMRHVWTAGVVELVAGMDSAKAVRKQCDSMPHAAAAPHPHRLRQCSPREAKGQRSSCIGTYLGLGAGATSLRAHGVRPPLLAPPQHGPERSKSERRCAPLRQIFALLCIRTTKMAASAGVAAIGFSFAAATGVTCNFSAGAESRGCAPSFESLCIEGLERGCA